MHVMWIARWATEYNKFIRDTYNICYVDARTGALFLSENMNYFEAIIELQDILFPEFYTVNDSDNNEYIFLKTRNSEINSLNKVYDKTQLEAYENHFHICGKVKKSLQKTAYASAKLITNNLIEKLKIKFPNKKFYIYLDCDFKDHIIIRFHQIWKNEEPYYDIRDFPNMEVYKIGIN